VEPARRRPAHPPWGSGSTHRASTNPTTNPGGRPLFVDSDKATVDAVEQVASERGLSMATVALAWVLRHPIVDAPIVGATKPQHLAATRR